MNTNPYRATETEQSEPRRRNLGCFVFAGLTAVAAIGFVALLILWITPAQLQTVPATPSPVVQPVPINTTE